MRIAEAPYSDEPLLAVQWKVLAETSREGREEDPPWPWKSNLAFARNLPADLEARILVAYEDDEAAGAAEVFMGTAENRHLLQASIGVLEQYRMRGIGRALLSDVVRIATEHGRSTLHGSTSGLAPAGEAFARRIGAEAKFAQHTNRLLLADVDRALLAAWTASPPDGYTLLAVDGALPDELIDRAVEVYDVMNTAPSGDLELDDRKLTRERVRENERVEAADGSLRWSIFVQHDESGVFAGYTEVTRNPNTPRRVGQLGTAVGPMHRGHRIGKWMKAAMLQRVLAECPDAVEVRTGNADSNEHMLAINRALGFLPFEAQTTWQVPVETVRSYLAGHPA